MSKKALKKPRFQKKISAQNASSSWDSYRSSPENGSWQKKSLFK
ncbi:hypothetical protein [Pedobacter polaris]|nr:hypothetical protein [Pedobacter polaris]